MAKSSNQITIVAGSSPINGIFSTVLEIINNLKGPGGLHQNSLEINFIVVSDRGE